MDNNSTKAQKPRPLVIVYLAAYLLLIILLPRFGVLKGAAQCFSYVALGLAGIFVFSSDFIKGLRLWKTKFLRSFIWLVAGAAAVLILINVAVIPAYLLGVDDIGGNTDALSGIVQALPLPFIIVALGVLGPTAEESVFRIFLVGKASQKIPPAICIIASSVLFSLLHLSKIDMLSWVTVLPTFASGLVYAFCYHKTQNITIPLILHILNNSSSFMLM